MFSVSNICGELQIGNRTAVDPPNLAFNTQDGKCYKWAAQIVDGELTGYWKDMTCSGASGTFLVDGKYYQWIPQMVDGVLTGYWNEVSEASGCTTEPCDASGLVNINGKYYQWTPTTVDGVVTGYWNETGSAKKFLNCIDGKYYRWVLTIVDGEMTGYWEEVI